MASIDFLVFGSWRCTNVQTFFSTHNESLQEGCTLSRDEMKVSNHSAVPVYTISGSSTARPLPEWLARKRKRSLKNDPEYASRIELLQDFEFEEASQCIRVSDDGQWVMSTGKISNSPAFSKHLLRLSLQAHINLRYIPITYHTFRCPLLAIPPL